MPVQLRFTGRAWVFGDDVDTDQITPGKYLAMITPEELGQHVLEGADEAFPKKVRPGDILVAGENFGCGSSREHAPLAIKGAGIPCVLAASFARIFYRNAYNVGVPAVEVPGIATAVGTGDTIEVDLGRGTVKNARTGHTLKAEPLTPKALELLEAGGLVPFTRQRLRQRAGPGS